MFEPFSLLSVTFFYSPWHVQVAELTRFGDRLFYKVRNDNQSIP